MSETIRTKNPLGYQPIGRLLMRFAIPSVVSMLVNALYNIVDQIFYRTGRRVFGKCSYYGCISTHDNYLSSRNDAWCWGSAYAAIKLGEKDEDEAENTLGNQFLMLVIIGIFITVVGYVFLTPILNLFGATPQNMAYSKQYASIILFGTTFNLLGIGLSNMARTDGSPNVAMYSMLVGAVLNTVLDPFYIFCFALGE